MPIMFAYICAVFIYFLIFLLMKLRILVSVYLDAKCYSAQKQVFARVIESELSDDDLMTVYRSCRVLFGSNCIVDIKIQDYAAV